MPKFRYTGTVSSGTIHPAILSTRQINVDVTMNGGVFLCTRPGFYQFSAALAAAAQNKEIGMWIVHNSREKVYAQ